MGGDWAESGRVVQIESTFPPLDYRSLPRSQGDVRRVRDPPTTWESEAPPERSLPCSRWVRRQLWRGPARRTSRMARCLLRTLALVGAFLAIAPAAQAAQCGLPDASPWWVDFSDGSVSFRDSVFKHPGVIAASTGAQAPASLRAGGAQTVYWYMHLDAIVGSPAAPAPAAGIPAAAAQLLAAAQASSGCTTPIIALNEMAGQDSPTPWSPGTTAYRQNIFALVSALTAGGARPFLLVPGTPHPPSVANEAAAWWQQVASVSDIVLEVYAAAPAISEAGPLLGSRALRVSFRSALQSFLSINVPAGRLGVMLGFQSGIGYAGREGLQPTGSWLEVVKLEALAARQVASELGISSVWSWGWGTFDTAGADPDKPIAACTYLWTRDPVLCDVPAQVEGDFNGSTDEGQILLAAGVQCQIGAKKTITIAAIDRLAHLTRGRQAAIGALLVRDIVRGRKATQLAIRRQEAAIIYGRFKSSRARYVAALARRGATPAVGRAALADGIKLQTIERGLHVPAPSAAAVRAWRKTHGGTRVRIVRSSIPVGWLGGSRSGIALPGSDVPPQVLRARDGQKLRVPTAQGVARITVGKALPLRQASGADANATVSALIRSTARDAAGATWLAGAAAKALDTAICVRDELPTAEPQSIAARAPFLRPLR
jgi:hypothetical protein